MLGKSITILTTATLLMGMLLQTNGHGQEQKTDPFAGKQFQSLKKLERGLTPTGVALGYWTIRFANGKFNWSYSDVAESGTYEYQANTNKFIARRTFQQRPIKAEYDPKTGILTWEKVQYKVVANK